MSAIFSECGLYRYRLDRDVKIDGHVIAFCGINPSAAGIVKNDPTVRKWMGFCKVYGARKLIAVNPLAYCSTKVKELKCVADPVGPDNHKYLASVADEADIIVPCWGNRSKIPKELRHHLDSAIDIFKSSGKPVMTFGYTKSGDPMHPLMLGYSTKLIPFI